MTDTALDAWASRFNSLLEAAKARYVPRIVLWGPPPSDQEGFKKRLTVAQAIRDEVPTASILFPEDPGTIAFTAQYTGDDPKMQEVLQAVSADLVFALDLSSGVSEEIARYSLHRDISSRLIIIAPESKRQGYDAIVRRTLKVLFIRDSEMMTCVVASNFCRTEVRRWLISKLLEEDLAYA